MVPGRWSPPKSPWSNGSGEGSCGLGRRRVLWGLPHRCRTADVGLGLVGGGVQIHSNSERHASVGPRRMRFHSGDTGPGDRSVDVLEILLCVLLEWVSTGAPVPSPDPESESSCGDYRWSDPDARSTGPGGVGCTSLAPSPTVPEGRSPPLPWKVVPADGLSGPRSSLPPVSLAVSCRRPRKGF